jgi:hypothetical protein
MNTLDHLLSVAGRIAPTLRTRFHEFLLLLLTGMALADAAAAADPPKDWRWLLPSQPIPYPVHPGSVDVAFGNGRFVAVGGSGVITSPDGLDWTRVLPGTLDYFTSVTFDGSKFVAIVGRGTGTSLDGTQWEFHPWIGVNNADHPSEIDYLGGMFVGIGGDPAANAAVLYTSVDGIQWTRRLRLAPSSPNAVVYFEGVAHGNGRFALLGVEEDYSSGEGISESFTYTSLNGSQWTKHLLPEADAPLTIAHGVAGFMMVDNGRILVSPDGISWEVRHELPKTAGSYWYSYHIATIGNRIVCYFQQQTVDENDNGSYSGHLALTSEDGFSWQETALPWTPPSITLEKLISNSSTFFLIGTDSLLTSPDGIVWTERFTPHPLSDTASLSDVVYGDHGFVAVGAGGTVLASADGLAWEKRASGTDNGLISVVYGQGRYVANGGSGTIIHSPDGQNWTTVDLEVGPLSLGPLAHGAGRFVLFTRTGSAGFWTSADGMTWQLRFSDALKFHYGISSVAFGNGRFVVTGYHFESNGGIYRAEVAVSEDGITWQRVVLPEPYSKLLNPNVIHDGNRFLAWGRNFGRTLLTSTDGLVWTTLVEGPDSLTSVGQGGGNLVAMRRGLLESSPNGLAWTAATPPVSADGFLRFAYGAGRFVGVGGTSNGSEAQLLVSGFMSPLALPQLDLRHESSRLMLRIRGNSGSRWTLQRSSTLQDWVTVGPLTLGTEPLDIDVTPTTETRSFWRLAAPDP